MQEDIKNQQNENLKPDEKPVQKSDIKDQESAGDQILNSPKKRHKRPRERWRSNFK